MGGKPGAQNKELTAASWAHAGLPYKFTASCWWWVSPKARSGLSCESSFGHGPAAYGLDRTGAGADL